MIDMVRELKKGCDDYIVEALEILHELATTGDEIDMYQHIRDEHPDVWRKWKAEKVGPEEYLKHMQEHHADLLMKSAGAINGIHDTCRRD